MRLFFPSRDKARVFSATLKLNSIMSKVVDPHKTVAGHSVNGSSFGVEYSLKSK